MQLSYETQGASSFLVYTSQDNEKLDTLILGMITNNRISGFAPAVYTQLNDTKYVKYNVSSRVSADQIFASVVNKKQLLGVFLGIVEALINAEQYMIPTDNIILDLKYIYVEVSTYNSIVICIPQLGYKNEVSLNMFLKNILFSTRFDEKEDSDYVARIISFLNKSEHIVLTELRELILSLKKEDSIGNMGGVNNIDRNFAFQPQVDYSIEHNTQNQWTEGQADVQPNKWEGVKTDIQWTEGQTDVQPNKWLGAKTDIQWTEGQADVKPNQRVEVQPGKYTPPTPTPMTPPMGRKVEPNRQPYGGVNIPGQSPTVAQTGNVQPGEKKMSLGYLLTHYSAENKEKYKAQKESAAAIEPQQKKKKKKKDEVNKGQVTGMVTPQQGVQGQYARQGQPPISPQPVGAGQQGTMPQHGLQGQYGRQPQSPMSQTVVTNQQGIQPQPVGVGQQGTMPQQSLQGQYGRQPQSPMSQTVVTNQQGIQPQPVEAGQQGVIPQQITPQQVGMGQQGIVSPMQRPLDSQPANFGQTTILGQNNNETAKTTVISNNTQYSPMPFLIRKKTNERVDINKPVFKIGKQNSYVDYFIADNSAISRSHANIITRDDKYYIIDTNSTNHTYIEGQMISPNQEVEIKGGQMIRLANEDFEFHLG